MTHRIVIAALLIVVGLGIGAFSWHAEDAARAERVQRRTALLIPPGATVKETDHYRIHYTAAVEQAERIASAVEKLYAGYTSVFPRTGAAAPGKLILVLYKDRRVQEQQSQQRLGRGLLHQACLLCVLRRRRRKSVSLDDARGDAPAGA